MKNTKSKTKSPKRKNNKMNFYLYLVLSFCTIALLVFGLNIKHEQIEPTITESTPEIPSVIMSDEQMPAFIEDKGELIEIEDIPTVEEVDGGLFEDATTETVSPSEYEDLGATIETFDTSTPEAFKNATLGLCIYANNRYGAQCVSLARSFWLSYAGRDVSTCGTGMAKGMMNCAAENAGDDFLVYWADDKDKIQAGDWLVFNGGKYGHVGMALGSVVNGYVTLLGENQGGIPCDGGGSATNIINLSIKNLIGFYRPKAYVKVEPTTPDTGIVK